MKAKASLFLATVLLLWCGACGQGSAPADHAGDSLQPLLAIPGGMVVLRVEPGGQAEASGIEVGDVLVTYDGVPVATSADMAAAMGHAESKTEVVVGLVGFDGEREVVVQGGRLGCGLDDLGVAGPEAAYNAACTLALEGRVDRAHLLLERAINDGYHDVDWLLEDADLESLHGHPSWLPLVDRCRAAQDEYMERINSELYALYQADQNDRSGEMPVDAWQEVADRDRDRRERVDSMIAAGELQAADDYFHAAMIFQHGDKPEHYARAHELAMQATELGAIAVPSRWLAAAAKDRHLLSIGEKQWYGTQFSVRDGCWELQPIDTEAVTDEQRREMDVPTLAETMAALESRTRAAQSL